MKFCSKCGKELLDEAVICPGCGCSVATPEATEAVVPKTEGAALAVVAFVFSFLIPIVGLICGIVGAAKYKTSGLRGLSVAAIVISIIVWIITLSYLL